MFDKLHAFLFLTIFLASISYISSGCSESKIIEEEKFIKIYTDILIAENTVSGTAFSNETILKRTLKKYNVTLDEYKATIQYYNQDSERWQKFFAKAIANLEAQKMSLAK